MQYLWQQNVNSPKYFNVMQKQKERAQKTQEHHRSVYQNVTSIVAEECAAKMPKLTSVATIIQRKRDSRLGPGDCIRPLVYKTEVSLNILERYISWHADGTF